ncbi:MAG: hypothetical protein KBC28_08970, partial [Alphaproteobacteria bacterium]|nr:hypothetical protein [Alphaproteobacteria bacterium]
NDQQADEEQPVEHRAEVGADQLEQVEEVIDDADLHAANDQQADEKPVEHRAEGDAEQLEQVEEVIDDADLHAANDQQADEKPVEHRAEVGADQLEQVVEVNGDVDPHAANDQQEERNEAPDQEQLFDYGDYQLDEDDQYFAFFDLPEDEQPRDDQGLNEDAFKKQNIVDLQDEYEDISPEDDNQFAKLKSIVEKIDSKLEKLSKAPSELPSDSVLEDSDIESRLDELDSVLSHINLGMYELGETPTRSVAERDDKKSIIKGLRKHSEGVRLFLEKIPEQNGLAENEQRDTKIERLTNQLNDIQGDLSVRKLLLPSRGSFESSSLSFNKDHIVLPQWGKRVTASDDDLIGDASAKKKIGALQDEDIFPEEGEDQFAKLKSIVEKIDSKQEQLSEISPKVSMGVVLDESQLENHLENIQAILSYISFGVYELSETALNGPADLLYKKSIVKSFEECMGTVRSSLSSLQESLPDNEALDDGNPSLQQAKIATLNELLEKTRGVLAVQKFYLPEEVQERSPFPLRKISFLNREYSDLHEDSWTSELKKVSSEDENIGTESFNIEFELMKFDIKNLFSDVASISSTYYSAKPKEHINLEDQLVKLDNIFEVATNTLLHLNVIESEFKSKSELSFKNSRLYQEIIIYESKLFQIMEDIKYNQMRVNHIKSKRAEQGEETSIGNEETLESSNIIEQASAMHPSSSLFLMGADKFDSQELGSVGTLIRELEMRTKQLREPSSNFSLYFSPINDSQEFIEHKGKLNDLETLANSAENKLKTLQSRLESYTGETLEERIFYKTRIDSLREVLRVVQLNVANQLSSLSTLTPQGPDMNTPAVVFSSPTAEEPTTDTPPSTIEVASSSPIISSSQFHSEIEGPQERTCHEVFTHLQTELDTLIAQLPSSGLSITAINKINEMVASVNHFQSQLRGVLKKSLGEQAPNFSLNEWGSLYSSPTQDGSFLYGLKSKLGEALKVVINDSDSEVQAWFSSLRTSAHMIKRKIGQVLSILAGEGVVISSEKGMGNNNGSDPISPVSSVSTGVDQGIQPGDGESLESQVTGLKRAIDTLERLSLKMDQVGPDGDAMMQRRLSDLQVRAFTMKQKLASLPPFMQAADALRSTLEEIQSKITVQTEKFLKKATPQELEVTIPSSALDGMVSQSSLESTPNVPSNGQREVLEASGGGNTLLPSTLSAEIPSSALHSFHPQDIGSEVPSSIVVSNESGGGGTSPSDALPVVIPSSALGNLYSPPSSMPLHYGSDDDQQPVISLAPLAKDKSPSAPEQEVSVPDFVRGVLTPLKGPLDALITRLATADLTPPVLQSLSHIKRVALLLNYDLRSILIGNSPFSLTNFLEEVNLYEDKFNNKDFLHNIEIKIDAVLSLASDFQWIGRSSNFENKVADFQEGLQNLLATLNAPSPLPELKTAAREGEGGFYDYVPPLTSSPQVISSQPQSSYAHQSFPIGGDNSPLITNSYDHVQRLLSERSDPSLQDFYEQVSNPPVLHLATYPAHQVIDINDFQEFYNQQLGNDGLREQATSPTSQVTNLDGDDSDEWTMIDDSQDTDNP